MAIDPTTEEDDLKTIVMVGNLNIGYRWFGPFYNTEAVATWCEGVKTFLDPERAHPSLMIVPLEDPESAWDQLGRHGDLFTRSKND